MKKILSISLCYLSWIPIQKWVNAVGLLSIIAGLALVFMPAASQSLLMVGTTIMLFFTLIIIGLPLLEFLGNRRLSMVPGFRIYAVYGLLFLTLVFSSLITLAYSLKEITEINVHPANIFIFSFICISTCFTCTLRPLAYIVTIFFLYSTPRLAFFLFSASPLVYISFLVVLSAITFLLWWSLLRPMPYTRQIESFNVKRRIKMIQVKNTKFIAFTRIRTGMGTLLRGMSDSWINRISMEVYMLVIMPFIFLFIITVISLIFDGNRSIGDTNYPVLIMIMSLLYICVKSFFVSEWVARSRFLWLRVNNDRREIWRSLEINMLADLGIIFTAILFLTGAVLLLSPFTVENATIFLFICIPFGLYSSYLAIWAKVVSSSRVYLIGISGFILISGFIVAQFKAVTAGNYYTDTLLLKSYIFLIGMVIFARYFATRKFMSVDWCKVRPRTMRRMINEVAGK